MSNKDSAIEQTSPAEGSVTSYTIGFILSVLFTLIPFWLVIEKVATGWSLVAVLFTFALAQLIVQLVFFLHLGKGSGAKWNVMIFIFMVGVVFIIGIGSIWIMKNLNYNVMPGHDMNQQSSEELDEEIIKDEGFEPHTH
jgi:cytochrome o ubiquinol oxidase operon protein cyoD